jgi:hypothetical protein
MGILSISRHRGAGYHVLALAFQRARASAEETACVCLMAAKGQWKVTNDKWQAKARACSVPSPPAPPREWP